MSKVNMMSAKDKKKGSLVPRLRFPEFRDEWTYDNLGDFLEEYSEKVNADTTLPIYSSTRDGLKAQKDYFNGHELINSGEYGVVPVNCFVYRHMSDDNIFIFNINLIGEAIAVSKEYPVFKAKNMSPLFLYYILNYGLDFKRFAAMQKKGGTRTRLYFSTLCSWKTLLPTKPEQQRIADCLSSLDERIAAETNKLDALKAHKKGLLKQLFPAEGETLPQLRFPEFQDAGEWEKSTVNDLLTESCQIGSKGNKAKKLTVKLWGKGVFEKEEIFQGSVNTQYYRRRSGQFIYSKLDFLNQAFGIIPHYLDGFESTVDLPCFDFRSDVNPIFFLEYVKREAFYKKFGEIADGGRKAKRIQVDVFLSFPVLLPPQTKEQQQIADCLSSLDELITAQGQKIELLKDHKKGLMQQLFLRIDEVLA